MDSQRIDLEPYLLFCRDDDQARFATWRMSVGHEALALFSDEERADQYRLEIATEASNAEVWNLHQPRPDALWQILEKCVSQRMMYAVLDPSQGTARRVFDLPAVLSRDRPPG